MFGEFRELLLMRIWMMELILEGRHEVMEVEL